MPIVVSHDAAFLDAIRIDRVIRLAAGEITD
jgi:ATPase subunit of ABC transporter with duplicated ATPase domains